VYLKHFGHALYAFLRAFPFVPEGVVQRSAKLRYHDVQALDGRAFRLIGRWPLQLRITTRFVKARCGVVGPALRRRYP
jgi:hypothetical protein